MNDMENKVAIVTGAGNGIGRAVARLLAKEGARVVVNDFGVALNGDGVDPQVAARVVEEIRAAGGDAVESCEDVSAPSGAAALVARAVETFGALDALVNTAGILRDNSLTKLSDGDFDRVVATHLRGTFLCMREAARVMKSKGGRIVNTTSVAGLLGNLDQANYAAAEAGVYGLTRTGCIELQRFGITVNAVAPLAKTRLTENLPMFQKVDSLTPEHVAPAYLFFASDWCGDRTGHVLGAAGGKLSTFRVVESSGQYKEAEEGIWRAAEIAEHWEVIEKL